MKTNDEKEKERSAREWLMRPLYNIMILALVILELFGKQIDAGTRNGFHTVLWIMLGCVVLLHIVAFVIKLGEKSTPDEPQSVSSGSEREDESETKKNP